jgi:light-regulated signal transduction histidine kinase (bacteriophytochrome)
VVSHDLKAPLRTIRSFGSFILEDYEDKLDETGKDYLNRMINASSHLDSMIEDLLVLSRVGRKFTELEKVDLNELLKEILADLDATIKERNAKVAVDKLPTLYVRRVWKRQLFTNLISNALKFNESKTPKIEVLYEERENDHLFKVQDNGIGIEEKYLERIFNLFERAPTDKKYEGTGAGLAICKKIVEQFGGKIWVESTPSKGSTFFFTIPKELKQTKEA